MEFTRTLSPEGNLLVDSFPQEITYSLRFQISGEVVGGIRT